MPCHRKEIIQSLLPLRWESVASSSWLLAACLLPKPLVSFTHPLLTAAHEFCSSCFRLMHDSERELGIIKVQNGIT